VVENARFSFHNRLKDFQLKPVPVVTAISLTPYFHGLVY
jgi:hypothetical protein